jgi:hypothetical protein
VTNEKLNRQNRQIIETIAAQVQMLTEKHIVDINSQSAANFDKVKIGFPVTIDRSVKPPSISVQFKIAPVAVKDSSTCELEDDTQPTLGLDNPVEGELPHIESADTAKPKKRKGAQPA